MADDFAIATAAPRSATIAGGCYLVGKLTPRDLGDLQAFVRESVPDPRLKARELCRDLPDAVAIEIWRDLSVEAKFWPPAIDSEEAGRALFMTGEGAARVLWVMLRRHNEGVDLERARRLADAVSFEELRAIFDMGFPENDFAPKSPRTPTTEATEDRGPVAAE